MTVTRVWLALLASACAAAPAAAQVTRLEILSRAPMPAAPAGPAGPYEMVRGRIHGEVDPADRRNRIIQDLALAPRNARGRVEYVATFALARPVDLSKASGVLMYTVVNRGNGAPAASAEGHVSLVSGWQGDLVPTAENQTIAVPIARQRDGSPITGPMVARFFDAAPGTTTMLLRHASIGNIPAAYPPAGLEQPEARLISVGSESPTGEQRDVRAIPRDSWAFADCRTVPFPGTPDPTRLCVKGGFDPARLYQLSYRVQDPLVLAIGYAATRDIVAFFRRAAADAQGTANPVAGAIRQAVAIGDSQSGNFIRTFIHLGFNEGLDGRMVWDGAFPRIAARQTPMNHRFAVPGGAAALYEVGSDGVVWWGSYTDRARKRKRASLLDRCTASKTCPKIVEAFGSAEFWGLRMSPDLVGTDATRDIPLPANVRRYYYPGTTHGGGRGGFALESGAQPGCSLDANPNPEGETTRALTHALVEWVVKGTEPPRSRYPRLDRGELVPADAKAMGFPKIPGVPDPGPLLNPLLEYDFGPGLVLNDLTGVLARRPPRVVRALPTLVPRTGPDGNETVDGVPAVLHQVPLGTYLGWNATAAGFFKGQGCGFAGGYLPFAKTRAERERTGDPRPSLEERYRSLDGYVRAVRTAAEAAVADRVLLRADADRLIAQARESVMLPSAAAAAAAQNKDP